MKFIVTEADLRPAYNAVAPRPPEGSGLTQEQYEETDEYSDLYCDSHVRMAAENGTVSFKTAWGTAFCRAEVAEPGVLFITAREWIDMVIFVPSLSKDPHEITVTDDYFKNEWGRLNAVHYDYAYFDDPAEAPETWEEIEWEEEPADESSESTLP